MKELLRSYLHINNGGLRFDTIEDNGNYSIIFKYSHFGDEFLTQRLLIKNEAQINSLIQHLEYIKQHMVYNPAYDDTHFPGHNYDMHQLIYRTVLFNDDDNITLISIDKEDTELQEVIDWILNNMSCEFMIKNEHKRFDIYFNDPSKAVFFKTSMPFTLK